MPLPADIAGFHDALLHAADEHDPIRMDHLVHGWGEARAALLPGRDEVETLRCQLPAASCQLAMVAVEVLVGDPDALAAGRGYVEQLRAAEAAVLAARAMVATEDPRTADVLERARRLVDLHVTVELRVALAEVESIVLWQGGDAQTAAILLGEAIDACERTGRPVAPDLRVMLCDILVGDGQWDALRSQAQALAQLGRLLEDDDLTSMGERYLARAGQPT